MKKSYLRRLLGELVMRLLVWSIGVVVCVTLAYWISVPHALSVLVGIWMALECIGVLVAELIRPGAPWPISGTLVLVGVIWRVLTTGKVAT